MARVRLSFRFLSAAWVIAAVAAAAAVTVSPAQAASFTVTNTNDSGPGSLRQAILDASASAGADTINFSVTGTITLASTLPGSNETLTIDGPGAASLTISGADSVHVLTVSVGALTLNGVTVADGLASSGGAIDNFATLTINNSILSGNSASSGGAIRNNSTGMLTVTNSTFSGNSASSGGGGILNSGGTLTVSNSTFSGNSAPANGGGILNNGGSLTLASSTFSGNSSSGGSAGIFNSVAGTAAITQSTFTGNSGFDGAGIGNAGVLTLVNSTISGNTAVRFGGGIVNLSPGALSVTNSTVAGNSASLSGGGVRNGGIAVTLRNTIVANSSSGGNCAGTSTDDGGNLSWPDTTCPGINQDPMLGALGNNGGPTQTMALPAGSPAVDAAVLGNCPTTDQRGVARPQGAGCDIGAFELEVTTLSVAIDIKPGDFPNSINTAKMGVIPVAVLGTSTFDPSTVDPSTVCFGDAENTGQRDCTVAPGAKLKDVNGDTILDLVLHFETQQTGIDPGDTQACLTGERYDATEIEGCDSIKTK